MKIYITDFLEGMLSKLAEGEPSIFSMINTSMFPNIEHQTSWKFSRKDSNLHLHDGNVVHSFNLPDGEKENEDFPAHKQEDLSIFNFDKSSSGTAQVHKANPGYVYVTLHDGNKNPTYTLKHVNNNEWRVMPKHKNHEEAHEVDKKAFEQVILQKLSEDQLPWGQSILDSLLKGAHKGVVGIGQGINYLANDPLRAAGIGLGAGAAYDLGKRTLYNSKEENNEESGLQRSLRYLLPTAALGGLGLGVDQLLPNRNKPLPSFVKPIV